MKRLTHDLQFEVMGWKIRCKGTTLIEDVEPPAQKKDTKPSSKEAKFCADLYHRSHETEWTDKEIGAYVKHKSYLTTENMDLLKAYFAQQKEQGKKGGGDYTRKDLLTFLNNLPGEIDRAKQPPQLNGTHKPNSGSGSGESPRNQGTLNSGKASAYAGVGKLNPHAGGGNHLRV